MDGNSIWCVSDLFEELHQFKEPFHGGYGIVNLNGIPKPVFYAMRMLAQAGNMRLTPQVTEAGQTEVTAFESSEEKQLLLYRFQTRQLPLPAELINIEVELDHEPKRVWLQRIDNDHCNPRRVWEEMGSPNDLNRQEVEQILAASDMEDEPIGYTYETGILATEVEVGVNDVYFIRILK